MKKDSIVWSAEKLCSELSVEVDQAILTQAEEELSSTLRPIAAYVAIWGVEDDGLRQDLMDSASAKALENLDAVVDFYYYDIRDWMIPQEKGAKVTDTYMRVLAVLMIFDTI